MIVTLLTKWHDKRDVNILSTNINPLTPPVLKQRCKKNGEIVEVEKPYCVEQYNQHMGGVDHSDQLRSYYSTCRSFHKWYKYLFWFILTYLCVMHLFCIKRMFPIQERISPCTDHKQLTAGYSSRLDNQKRS